MQQAVAEVLPELDEGFLAIAAAYAKSAKDAGNEELAGRSCPEARSVGGFTYGCMNLPTLCFGRTPVLQSGLPLTTGIAV